MYFEALSSNEVKAVLDTIQIEYMLGKKTLSSQKGTWRQSIETRRNPIILKASQFETQYKCWDLFLDVISIRWEKKKYIKSGKRY